MASIAVAGNAILCLKDWFKSGSAVDEFIQMLNEIHHVLYETDHKSTPFIENLGLDRKGLVHVFNSPNSHGQFCRLAFKYVESIGDQKISTDISWELLYEIILKNISRSSFMNIMDCFVLAKNTHTLVQIKIAECFQYAMENHYMSTLIWKECLEKPIRIQNGKPIFPPEIQMEWTQLIQCIISMPEKISNQLELKTSSLFRPTLYFSNLANDITDVMKKMYSAYQSSQECHLSFVSQLFGKICATGKVEVVYKDLIPQIMIWVKESPLWCQICSRIFLSVPDTLLESCLEPLIKKAQSADLLSRLFNETILSRPKLKFLLTHKFLFVRIYEDDAIPFCILSYLAGKVSFESCFKETLIKLLDVWGERSSIKHTSLEQHMYLSKCLLMAISFLNDQQKKSWKSELTLKLMEAVPAHLESPNQKLHRIGMIVAECFTSSLDKDGKKLNFELDRNEEEEYLFKLSVKPSEAIRNQSENVNKIFSKLNSKLENKSSSHSDINANGSTKIETCVKENKVEELDSDDDLEPLNLDEDEGSTVNGVRSPVYLRDCMAGLISSRDPNRMEACLKVVKKLVLKEPGDLNDVVVELVKILLHMKNEYTIENYDEMKRDAMIEVTVKCPTEVVSYITEQFYAENYSLMQRCDMLDILSTAALRLSSPVHEKSAGEFRSHLPLPALPGQFGSTTDMNKKPVWQAIIDERIESKTRRFVKGPSKELPLPKKNRFTPIAGLFFFPLLQKFGKSLNTCNMLGKDSMILGKFIYTLGVVIQCADGLPIVVLMGKSLFDLIWSLRYHKEAYVRQSLIYACTMITLHLPSFSLVTDLQLEMFEARDWLQELVQGDPNVECRKLAGSCLVVMQKRMQKELMGNG